MNNFRQYFTYSKNMFLAGSSGIKGFAILFFSQEFEKLIKAVFNNTYGKLT